MVAHHLGGYNNKSPPPPIIIHWFMAVRTLRAGFWWSFLTCGGIRFVVTGAVLLSVNRPAWIISCTICISTVWRELRRGGCMACENAQTRYSTLFCNVCYFVDLPCRWLVILWCAQQTLLEAWVHVDVDVSSASWIRLCLLLKYLIPTEYYAFKISPIFE